MVYTRIKVITPSDSEDDNFTDRVDAIFITVAGNLAVVINGATFTLPVTAGQILPIRPDRIATATTATGLFALYAE